ncbi:endo-1,3-1,4-beta-D-glucanase [Bisporella sp. PMI_857]|nr:endo-1,3-1,4-beta-D-glucanase [Bisporella sp. PMI_857]
MVHECCRTGFQWVGKPTGHEGTLGQNNAYIAGSNKSVAVLLVHDLFGWKFNNLRLLADHFAAEADCTCYVPDFYGGDIIPEETIEEAFADPEKLKLMDLPGYLERNSKAIRSPEIFACAKALRSQYQKVGAIGYCWGGWGVLQLGARGQNLVDCITIAHPSLLTKEEIDALGVPTQIVAPEFDPALTEELKSHANRVIPTLGIEYRYDFYPGLAHGFAVKGDQKDEKQKSGLERAKNAAVGWFNEFLH